MASGRSPTKPAPPNNQSIHSENSQVLTSQEIETIRAALQFWCEEIAPHGESAARPYLESAEAKPLSALETNKLRNRLAQALWRFAVVEPSRDRLANVQLYGTLEEAAAVAGSAQVVTVLLPTV